MVPPSSLVRSSGGGLVDPLLRASNEALPRARVPRAGGRPGHLPLPLQSAVEGVPREAQEREAAQSVAVSYQAWSIFIPHALARPTTKTPMKSGWVCPFAMARSLSDFLLNLPATRPCQANVIVLS